METTIIQSSIHLFLWQISLLSSLIFIIFFMVKVLLFIKKVSLYIDLKVAYIEHLIQEISS